MENLAFSFILFIIYFYVFGSIAYNKNDSNNSISSNFKNDRLSAKVDSLSYNQLLKLLGKQGYNSLPDSRKLADLKYHLLKVVDSNPSLIIKFV